MVENNSKIQAIVSAHRDYVLSMFKADVPASRMVDLRMENLCSMKSSMALLESKLSLSLPSVLQELLVKLEEEAMRLFQIVSAHRDEALEMFKADLPASKMVSLRMENLSAMKSSMSLSLTLPPLLQELLVTSEDEAMLLFQKERLLDSNISPVMCSEDSERVEFGHDHYAGFGCEETKNDDLIKDEILSRSDKSPGNAIETDGSLDFGCSNQNGINTSRLEVTRPRTEPSATPAKIGRRHSDIAQVTNFPPSASSTVPRISSQSLIIVPSSKSTVITFRDPTKKKSTKWNSKRKQVPFSPQGTNVADIASQRSSTSPNISSKLLTIDPFASNRASSRECAKSKTSKSCLSPSEIQRGDKS